MGSLIQEEGNAYGDWLVLERAASGKNGQTMWICRCSCGSLGTVQAGHLREGKSQRCRSCKEKRQFLPGNKSSFNDLYRGYKNSARNRNLVFELDKELFAKETKKNCVYCGEPPTNRQKHPNAREEYIYNGLDRVDNAIGYTATNVVPCCKVCNMMKGSFDKDEFLLQSKKITQWRRGR